MTYEWKDRVWWTAWTVGTVALVTAVAWWVGPLLCARIAVAVIAQLRGGV